MDVIDLLACDNYLIINRDLMRALGVAEAMLIGELASELRYWKKANKLVDGEWFYSTNENLEDRIPFSRPSLKKAADHLEEIGLIETKLMGVPAKKYYRINAAQLEKFFKQDCKKVYNLGCKDFSTKNIEEEYTTTSSGGSALDFGMMKAIVQKFVRDHQSQSNPITFTPSKLKEYYPALKEWAIDNGIKLDRQKVLTVLENALDEIQNDGWLAGKDMAIAFKDTCIGSRIKKQQKKGGLNDNEWV